MIKFTTKAAEKQEPAEKDKKQQDTRKSANVDKHFMKTG